jgi:mersacidin/lichenicidin family type 2 lantibiotic
MNTKKIIRVWKDEEYRLSLSAAERALLPSNPAGLIELMDADLEQSVGGAPNSYFSCGSTFAGECRSTSYNCFTIACR